MNKDMMQDISDEQLDLVVGGHHHHNDHDQHYYVKKVIYYTVNNTFVIVNSPQAQISSSVSGIGSSSTGSQASLFL
jgi:hypothetical protein